MDVFINLMLSVLLFTINNIQSIIITIFIAAIIYTWLDFIFNKQYKNLYLYNTHYYIKNTNDIDEIISRIKHISGREFEEFCVTLFKKTKKYKKVSLTPSSNDEGKDIILTDRNNIKSYVECKQWSECTTNIGREVCQKFIGAMISDNILNGIIITTGRLNQNAWDYLSKIRKNTNINIEILEIEDIEKLLNNSILDNKNRKEYVREK